MALERLVLLQMQTFVNRIYYSILIIHGNAIKILHFNYLNCTSIVYNLYRSHCFANNSWLLITLTKSFHNSHTNILHHTLKLYNRDSVNNTERDKWCVLINRQLSGKRGYQMEILTMFIWSTAINSNATICECMKS